MGLLYLYSRQNLKSHTGCVTSAYFTRTLKYQKQVSTKDSTVTPGGTVVLYLKHKPQLHTYYTQKWLLRDFFAVNEASVSYKDGETVTTLALIPHKVHVAEELHD
jgi:hypothetical protein